MHFLVLSGEWIRDNVLIVFLKILRMLVVLSSSLHRLSLVFAMVILLAPLEIEVLFGLCLPLVLTRFLMSERPKVLCLAKTQKLSMLHLLYVFIGLACSLLLVYLAGLVISYGL
jgi:hypothetical protein